MAGRMLVGTPEGIAGQVEEAALAVGLDGVILNFPANGADTGAVEAVGAAVRRVVGA
jgi:alkanesulfonate monooxygenase SsuD/methylene tetrahydromethanopterin reductase-like flavin-dependent oxidoreductase (luciferase family)